jgi:hypothetical protein
VKAMRGTLTFHTFGNPPGTAVEARIPLGTE